MRNNLYDRHPSASRAAPIPVLSVGNLTVGGVGKTPMVIALVTRLIALGRRPAVVTRGYGARPGHEADEVLELRAALPAAPVIVDADRVRGATAAAEQGADVVVLDDGFQHRRLRRDLDIVLIDALNPWGGGCLLPAGRLREPLASLRRAHVVVITRANQADPEVLAAIERDVRRHAPDAYVCCATVAPVGLTLLDPSEPLAVATSAPLAAGARVLPVCGIGNPASFLALLRTLAAHVSEPGCIFRDHHHYTAADVVTIRATATQRGVKLVVTTRKDWVKLAPLWRATPSDTTRRDAAQSGDKERGAAPREVPAARSMADAEAASVPRLARLDVETVLHEDSPRLDRLLAAALAHRRG